MASFLNTPIDEELKSKTEIFLRKLESEMHFKSDLSGDLMNFDWVDVIEQACPFIDNVVRKPKLTLVQEENVVKVEKSKRINVSSVKDLARHTN